MAARAQWPLISCTHDASYLHPAEALPFISAIINISTVFTVVIAVYSTGSLVRVSIHTVWLMASYTSICTVYRVTFVIDCFLHRPSCRDMNSGLEGQAWLQSPASKHVFFMFSYLMFEESRVQARPVNECFRRISPGHEPCRTFLVNISLKPPS